MTETGHRGGLINHPEIRHWRRISCRPIPMPAYPSTLETLMKEMIWFVPWQTVHFFGYCLIFGAAFAVVLRVLGFWKSASFAAMHQLLVLGFLGVLMNVVSGMLMMLSDSYRYVVSDAGFAPKIALHLDRRDRGSVFLGVQPALERQGGREMRRSPPNGLPPWCCWHGPA